jgi:DNA-binding NarL/FixJ family response regulator
MGRVAYLNRGGTLGRKYGSNESIAQFLAKPKSKEIISLLDKGKSVRDIAGRLNVSLNLVVKVRKHYLNRMEGKVA